MLNKYLKFDHEIIISTSPDEAIQIVKSENNAYNPFDLAIIDYFMPEMSGIELGEQIARIDPDISIAIITADNSEEVYEEILNSDLELEGFIRKKEPFSVITTFLEHIIANKEMKLSGKKSIMKQRIRLY